MAEKSDRTTAASGTGSVAERIAKSQVTRKITGQKLAKLNEQNRYAYGKLASLRSAVEKMQSRILDGGTATGELVQSCAELEANIGVAMFS
jgi:predicted negative regulator of RcsB-dependent stress response